jgi:hypothetical protein
MDVRLSTGTQCTPALQLTCPDVAGAPEIATPGDSVRSRAQWQEFVPNASLPDARAPDAHSFHRPEGPRLVVPGKPQGIERADPSGGVYTKYTKKTSEKLLRQLGLAKVSLFAFWFDELNYVPYKSFYTWLQNQKYVESRTNILSNQKMKHTRYSPHQHTRYSPHQHTRYTPHQNAMHTWYFQSLTITTVPKKRRFDYRFSP